MSASEKSVVFVFGTLKEGFPNFATNRGQRIPGEYRTVQRYPLYLVGDRHSPWMIDTPGQGEHITGQLFIVDGQALADMDRLERISAADGYRRREIDVTPAQGENADDSTWAFVYVKPHDQLVSALIRKGPLPSYELEDAALYRPR
ncbi:gamma-glutamylcyclotransferase [Ralstonia pickettii]|uniref:Gamma-glutamylcyclotransferase family protein n=1 Tax=Ralstonia pickettii TaxID=329 RepID=A0A7X2L8Z5_RALPI|nr:gamma-glutamylcyclotransferase family protein [Ralstonia pickettii]MRS97504.1 gamma-glutamylcyclotransferase [Ralstonia pickettii]